MKKIKTAALIISYNPDLDLLRKNVDSVCSQVEEVLIVDNASCNCEKMEHIFRNDDNVKIICNSDNLGIASALNIGMRWLNEKKYEWVLTLDQDSVCEDRLVDELEQYVGDDVGIVCPRINYVGWEQEKTCVEKVEEIRACMTSASLTNVEAWKICGGYNDAFFIDFVDNDFCERLHIAGYRVIRNNKCELKHKLGESFEKNFLGVIKFRYTLHAPLRYYYMTRNNLVFIWTYRNRISVFVEYLKLLYVIFSGLIFAEDRRRSIAFVRKGYLHAKSGQMGKYRG